MSTTMRFLSILIIAFGGLVVSVPQHGANLFRPEPRASYLNWNAPRDHGGFLSKRSNLLSEEYFNNPPVKRTPDTSPAHPVVPLTNSSPLSDRATSGQWENLEGSSSWNPTPACWGGPQQHVYYVHKDRTCKYRTYDGGKWGGWQDIGGSFDSPAAACSRKQENMHIFCKGSDGQAWHRSYDSGGGGWGQWQGMGGDVKHYPSACSWGKDHVSVYVSATDGQCWHRRYDDVQKGWYGWENMGGYLDGPPKAVTWGQGHTSVFCKGQDGQAWHRKYESSGWGSWESLGGTLDGEPAACAWDGRMDVFVKGSDGACWHKTYKRGTGWGGWENMGGKIKGGKAPDVVYYGGKMELYITGDDNALYRKVWKDDKWTPDWENMGGSMYTKPNAVAWDDGKMDVYGAGSDGSCKRCY